MSVFEINTRRRKAIILVISAIFFVILVLVFINKNNETHVLSSTTTPTELTSSHLERVQCIGGVAHPTDVKLTFVEQYKACDRYVAVGEDLALTTNQRAFFLAHSDHRALYLDQIYDDLTYGIEQGRGTAWAFYERGRINLTHRGDLDAALSDLNVYADMTEPELRATHLVFRALTLLSIAERDSNEEMVYIALRDTKKVFELDPENEMATRIEEWAALLLRNLHQSEGRSVSPG